MEATPTDKIELIQTAIQKLIDSKANQTHHVDDKDTHLLTNLLSQVESLKEDGTVKLSEPLVELNQAPTDTDTDTADEAEMKSTEASASDGAEQVIKELKKLERQNRTTHWLLSALIVVTVAWQISEVSLVLKLKGCLTRPFRSLGSIFTGALKPPQPDDEESME